MLFDMLDSLTLSLLFLCKYEKGFFPVVGVEGHCGCISRSLSQFFFQNVLWCFRQNIAAVGIIGNRAFCARLHIPKDCNIMASL